LTSGSFSEPQIEEVLILLRAFGAIMGLQPLLIENILDEARTALNAGKDKRPGQGGGGPPE